MLTDFLVLRDPFDLLVRAILLHVIGHHFWVAILNVLRLWLGFHGLLDCLGDLASLVDRHRAAAFIGLLHFHTKGRKGDKEC